MNDNDKNYLLAEGARTIVLRLRAAGFQALFAGGCVRDLLLGRVPKDFDVVTDARPDTVLNLFPKSVAVGKAFGVVRVGVPPAENGPDVYYDVATFRTDGAYSDGRHPQSVAFADEETDAARRDFTINAMFFDPVEKKIRDHAGGQEDLEKKIIRTVGDPDKRFQTMDDLVEALADCFTDRVFLRDAHRMPGVIESGIVPPRTNPTPVPEAPAPKASITSELSELFTNGSPIAEMPPVDIDETAAPTTDEMPDSTVHLLTREQIKAAENKDDEQKSGETRRRTRTSPGIGVPPLQKATTGAMAPMATAREKRPTSALSSKGDKSSPPRP